MADESCRPGNGGASGVYPRGRMFGYMKRKAGSDDQGGSCGMGRTVCDAVRAANDMELVCGIDPHRPEVDFPVYPTVAAALESWTADVLVDFTQPSVVADNLREALPAGVDCVVGTTGLSNETLQELAALAPDGTCLFYAPNFTTGAVLMMEFAKAAAPYFPEAEVIEFHHCNKKDAPSGTAVRTAQIIAEARGGRASEAPGRRAGAFRALDGLRRQPGSDLWIARPDAVHPS